MLRNAAIFSFIKPTPTSIVASNRIATYLSTMLKLPIIHDASIADKDLDTLIMVNGAFPFCKHLADLSRAIRTAKQLVWVQNDYTIALPPPDSKGSTPFRAAFRQRALNGLPNTHFWTTIKSNVTRTDKSAYVNWNALTFSTEKFTHTRVPIPESTLFYYGAYRVERVPYFDRFFAKPVLSTVIASSSPRFAARYPDCAIEPAIPEHDLYHKLSRQGLGLYIEDARSHRDFHSPANRFYEMLSAGLPMVFQHESVPMLTSAGIKHVEDFVVSSSYNLGSAYAQRAKIRERQHKLWWSPDIRPTLDDQVRAAVKKLQGRK